jgi:hypothetical protein
MAETTGRLTRLRESIRMYFSGMGLRGFIGIGVGRA